MEDGRPAYSPSPPCHWTRTINPLYLDDRELPTPPTICSEPLAREYATLKDAINFQAKHRTAPDARPSNYDIDLRSNKILELTGDAAMRLAVITVARRRYPGLNAGGIDVSRQFWIADSSLEALTSHVYLCSGLCDLSSRTSRSPSCPGTIEDLFPSIEFMDLKSSQATTWRIRESWPIYSRPTLEL